MFLIQLEELFNKVYSNEKLTQLSLKNLKGSIQQGDVDICCPKIDSESLALDLIRVNIFINNIDQKPFFRASFGVVLPSQEEYIFRYDVDFNAQCEVLDDYVYKNELA